MAAYRRLAAAHVMMPARRFIMHAGMLKRVTGRRMISRGVRHRASTQSAPSGSNIYGYLSRRRRLLLEASMRLSVTRDIAGHRI